MNPSSIGVREAELFRRCRRPWFPSIDGLLPPQQTGPASHVGDPWPGGGRPPCTRREPTGSDAGGADPARGGPNPAQGDTAVHPEHDGIAGVAPGEEHR